jgi:PAS domain S-box-containing protein
VTHESFVALVSNTMLLLSLVYVYDLLNLLSWVSGTWIRQVVAGLAIGVIGICVMLIPWTFVPGIIFDTRSVLLSVSGLFFGTIPTVVAVLMTAAFRLLQGGGGAWTGVLLIVASAAIGVAWRHARKRQLASLSFRTLYFLGLVVHVVMLALMFAQPLQTALRVLSRIALPVLTIYPLGTAAIGALMVNWLKHEQAAQALKQSEMQFRALSEQAAIGVTKTETASGKYVFANQRFADIIGYTRNELLTMDFHELTHPDDLTDDLNNVDLLVKGELHEYSMEKRYRRKDGKTIWVNLTVSPLWQEGEPPKYLIGLVEDISERKRAEEALRRHDAYLAALHDTSLELINRLDLTDLLASIVTRATLLVGTPHGFLYLVNPEETHLEVRVGTGIYAGYIGYQLKPGEGLSGQVWQTGQPMRVDDYARWPHRADSFAHSNLHAIAAVPLKSGDHVIGVIGVGHIDPDLCFGDTDIEILLRFAELASIAMDNANLYQAVQQDISERKRAGEETQRERAFFDRLVETAPEGIAITDSRSKVMRVNAEFVRMFGYGADEAIGQDIDDLVAPPALEQEARGISKSTNEGKTVLLETMRRRKDGTLVDVSLIVAPILIAGKQEAVYAIYRDITKRKRAEEASEKAGAQLRQSQKMEAIGQLAGGVAHDFNNLLTGILGNITLMRGSLPPADPLLENLNAAETAAHQAADLTKKLLTFSRSAIVLPVPMNITAALDATMALLKQSLPATMEIVRDYEQTTWNVLVDQSQMTQILLNLAVNARDAMKGKGTLTIRARNEVVGEEYLQTHPFARTGEFVHLSVTDTGPGMSSEVMQHLFEPFYTTKPLGSGTGLGLSVVYGAVKQAGGWITAVSTEGVGVTFDIYLPRCLEEPMQPFTPSPFSVNVRGGTVLVVEDEPVVCAVAQALLSRSGYTVLTAANGASALNVLQDHPVGIRLILLDMTMPGMTTGEIVRAIRTLDPTVPILLNSGYTSNGAVKQMLAEDSVQGFLGKPYDLDQLLGKVQELLYRS